MPLDPRTPVLVGAGAVQQREEYPRRGREPIELMLAALRRAAVDAGDASLLARADSIRVPRGFWDYSDPGRLLGERLGATRARSQLAEIGVLQTTLFGGAVEAIASGAADVVLVAGGEAKFRALRAQVSGIEAPATAQRDVEPDETLRPAREIWGPLEESLGLLMPVTQFAMIENALRHAAGTSVAAHRAELARLWADFSRVAAANPAAWDREPHDEAALRGGDARNRLLAFPYAKLHNSQWNVDQAAGLIFTSVATARAAGIDERRWVFPLAVAESNHMVPLSERAEVHRSHGFRLAGARALEHAELAIGAVAHLELYSCFPAAVRVQTRELGIDAGRPLTESGGMAFAGGPLNNFVLQALVRMVEVLRADAGSSGLVSAVSGMLTKQGVSLWSTRPPRRPCAWLDVSDAVAAATR
ncbi:MAG: acetyl-CoA acetyltransferase, partial [Deltaproteobacteria bacterium]|nr:acetyl-CoA acetyltransferase [Deltaproteobacteria bacterium]